MAHTSRPEWMVVEDLKQLQRQKCQDNLEAEKMKMDRKAELRNLERRLRAEQAEAEMEENLAKEREDALVAAAQREKAESLIAETNHLRREELRERKIRKNITVIGDSHARHLSALMREITPSNINITGVCKPNAGLLDLIPTSSSSTDHCFVIVAGTNDVAAAREGVLFESMERVLRACSETSLVLVTPLPPRHDLPQHSSIHKTISLVNNYISELCYRIEGVEMINISGISRNNYTAHGMHLRNSGKRLLAWIIVDHLSRPKPRQPPTPGRPAIVIPMPSAPAPPQNDCETPPSVQLHSYVEAVSNSSASRLSTTTSKPAYENLVFLGNPPLTTRQQLRESSEELKTLEARLRAAYVSKELAAQIAEKRASAAMEKVERRKIQEAAEAERRHMEEQEREQYQTNLDSRIRYRIELQNQIISAYKRQQEAYQEFIKEKALLDQIVRAIHEEDQREEEIRMEKMKQTKQEIEQFRLQQEIWKQREKEEREEEDRRIKKYLEEREIEEKKKLEELKEKEETKKKLQEQLGAVLISQLERKREREEILAELAAEELREREVKKAKQEIEEAVRRRQELQRSYRQQLEERRKKLQEEEEQQDLYKQQLLAKFAEDARLEQMTKEKRRLKILEHRRQVQQLLEERQRRRQQEWEELAQLEALRKAEEKHRRELIEEERVRLLKTHATKLLGYLPRGVLRQDDLTHLGSDFLEEFNKYKTLNCPRNAVVL